MKLKYKVFIKECDGTIHQSAGTFSSVENAKKAIKKYHHILAYSETNIIAYKIVNIYTNEIVVQFGNI